MPDLLPTVVWHLLRVAARRLKRTFCGAHERKTFPAKSAHQTKKLRKVNLKTRQKTILTPSPAPNQNKVKYII